VGMGNFLQEQNWDGENLIRMGWGWGQFNLPCHSLLQMLSNLIESDI